MVHGIARQFPTSGAFEADTVQCEVVVGGGHALVALDALTGVARWMKPLGFSTTVYPNSIARRLMDVDPNGNTYCAATLMGDSGRFDTDTVLAVPAGGWVPYLAKYNSNGDLEMIRTYGPDTYLSAVDVTSDGTLLLLGGSNVGSDVDICDGDTGVFMVRVDSTGDCLGAVHVAYGAQGLSAEEAASGIYLTCGSTFPSGLPFTFAGDSFVGYDFSDVLLGKHSLNVGVGSFRAAENNALEIYANPNNGSFRLRIPDAFAHEQQLQLAVYDGACRMVAQQPLVLDSDAPRLDLYGIGAGLYNVTLSNGERAYHGSMVVE
ncbi:MAG: hypothetical protein IPO17_03305 [Flavobacteriales bacterium]|nr:hypothetical protein [Flavobacteriales bacterium]